MEYDIPKRKLATVLKLDEHSGPDGRYHIRSLYFDDFKIQLYSRNNPEFLIDQSIGYEFTIIAMS
jgi:hypothetical protein